MKLKTIGKAVSSPIWVPLLPLIYTIKRLQRTHDDSRAVIGDLHADIRQKLAARKGQARTEEQQEDSAELSFEEAVQLAERNAAIRGEQYSLAEVRQMLVIRKRMILALAYLIFLGGMFTLMRTSMLFGMGMLIFSASMMLFAVPAQFRIWQIDNRRLSKSEKGGFADFQAETNWVRDTLNPRLKSQVSRTLLTALLVVSLGAPIAGHAENLDDLTTAADRGTDISRQAMVTLFGQIVNDPLNGILEDGGDSLVSQVLKVFSSTLLIVGTAMGGYIILRKTSQTAHDGVFLDKDQASVWMPIRVLAAFSLLTPLPNGWSLSALLMLYAAAKIGVGGANIATDLTVDAFMNGQSFVLQPAAPSTVELSRSLFEANLCMFGINASLDNLNSVGGFSSAGDYINQSGLGGDNGFILKSRSYTCGGATIAVEEEQSLLAKLGISADIDINAIREAHATGLNEMQRALRDGAQQFVDGVLARQQNENASLVNAESIIQNASQIYENKVTAAIRSSNINSQLKNLTSQVGDTIKTEGWMSLGSWYQTLAVANNRIGNTAAAKGSAFGASTGQRPAIDDEYRLVMSAYQAQRSVTDNSSAGVLTAKSSYETNQSNDTSGIMGFLFEPWGQQFTHFLISFSEGDNSQVNPLIAMKNLGDYVLVASQTGLASYGIITAATEAVDNSLLGTIGNFFTGAPAALKGLLSALRPFIVIGLTLLIGCGITLSVYLPLMPFLIWTAACVNYLVIIGEAIYASALWAFSHLLGNGEGMGQKTTHGYIFLLNLMFRPTLMVGGFLLGGGIMVVAGTFLNKTLPAAIGNSQFDSVTGVATVICLLLIYCSFAISLCYSSFGLINVVPDQVINWVGGHMANTAGRESHDRTQQMMGAFANKTEGNIRVKSTSNNQGGGAPKQPPTNSIK
ncbi:DotA/TraY family protein [Enterobacter ludwigii]|uniref:DotA/TraY family protein n=1 Tax=Enterobacter ludwigii TaxID=299767 RepID=A0AAX3LJT7_9ENTR|nr:DotA/TraY family protein [Enterobacter ludwigii]WCE16234.1 DotA/TraY family protein [Enterobacter ludwigii]HDT2136636.1 DotA/TraY family protein [Enterobacter roggenkampii]